MLPVLVFFFLGILDLYKEGREMKVNRYLNKKKISREELSKITIDSERIADIIKSVEKRIQ